MGRCDVDDPSEFSLLHGWPERFAQVECSTEVQPDDLFPFIIREILYGRHMLHPGIVDQYIHRSKFLQRIGGEKPDRIGIEKISAIKTGFDVVLLRNIFRDLRTILLKSVKNEVVISCF